jgi:GABA(A) receptor-associated protein
MSTTPKSFQEQHSFDTRQREAARMRSEYPNRVPVIVQPTARSHVPAMKKRKFLIDKQNTVSQLMLAVRRSVVNAATAERPFGPESALFLYTKKDKHMVLHPGSQTMANIDDEYRDEDGFIYMTVDTENTFG